MKDNLYITEEDRAKLISGIRKIAVAVGGTMGTGGANSMIEVMENPGHMVTNDGYTIASSIRLADPIEEMGRKALLEPISRANKSNGDGSSTTCTLTDATLTEGQKYIGKVSPMELKRSLEECIPLIEESINKQKREIIVDEVGDVAAISAEDKQIGATIQEIYQQIGKTGIIHWDISKTAEDSYSIGKGITIAGAGFVSPYMADLDEKTGGFLNVARWKNPKVLITKQKITSAAEFNDLFLALFNQEIKEIVVFCDEYESNIIPDLIKTRAVRGFKILLVKMPVLWKDWWYEDLAKASGATIIDPNAGVSLKNMTMEHLGIFGHITVSKDDTFIDGIKDISEYIKALEEEETDSSKLRASKLSMKTARYFVGAHSDSALSYRRLKVEDAIAAAWHALNGGVVAGGGSALYMATKDLPDTIGGQILKIALLAPVTQIVKNAGYQVWSKKRWYEQLRVLYFIIRGSPWIKLGADFDEGRGFDTRSKTFVNMFEAHITDPATIVFNAAKNAVSVAATILTTKTIVTLPREEEMQGIPTRPVII